MTPAAARQLRKITAPVRRGIAKKIESLAENPRPSGCKHLAAIDAFRVRVQDYRIIYQVEDDVLLITVIRVGHRGEVYRMLKNL